MAQPATVPTIRTQRLLLRPPLPADAGPIGHYSADPRLARMTAAIPHPYPPGAAAAWLEGVAGGRVAERVWVIDASPIDWSDMVGLIVFRPAVAMVDYWIGVPFWGTGFASEAVEALVRHLFVAEGVPAISAEVMLENEAALRVLEKAGFVRGPERPIYSVARGGTVPGVLLVATRG